MRKGALRASSSGGATFAAADVLAVVELADVARVLVVVDHLVAVHIYATYRWLLRRMAEPLFPCDIEGPDHEVRSR